MRNIGTLLTAAIFLLLSCSGADKHRADDKKNEHIKREYIVVDASSEYRPGWIEDAKLWAKKNGENTKEYRYFSFETDIKASKKVACDLAHANVKAAIASEISTSIERKLNAFLEGQSSVDPKNPEVQSLKEYVETSLKEQVQTHIHGAQVVGTYWEKRQYKKDLDAPRNFAAWTCANFARMSAMALEKAVKASNDLVLQQAESNTLKQDISQALENNSNQQ